MTNELTTRNITPLVPQDVPVGELLAKIVQAGITSDSAGALKELVLLQNHQQDRAKKQAWNMAFSRVRGRLNTVIATRAIPDKSGSAKWKYANLEDIQDDIDAILHSEGMTTRFDSRRDGDLCVGICWLSHEEGHEEKSECAIKAPGAMGGDLGAFKIAKRGALVAILGIKVRQDDDARMLGDFISTEQAEDLQRRLKAIGRDDSKFLAFAGARSWQEIRQAKLGILDGFLRKAEKAGVK